MRGRGICILTIFAFFTTGCVTNIFDGNENFAPFRDGVSDWRYSVGKIGNLEGDWQDANICFDDKGYPHALFRGGLGGKVAYFFWDGEAWRDGGIQNIQLRINSLLYYSSAHGQLEVLDQDQRYIVASNRVLYKGQGVPSAQHIVYTGATAEGYIQYVYFEKIQVPVGSNIVVAFRPREAIYDGVTVLIDRVIDFDYSCSAGFDYGYYSPYRIAYSANFGGDHSVVYYTLHSDKTNYIRSELRRAEFKNGAWERVIIDTRDTPANKSLPLFNSRVVWDAINADEYFLWDGQIYKHGKTTAKYDTTLPSSVDVIGAVAGILYTDDGCHFSPSVGYDYFNKIRNSITPFGNAMYNNKMYTIGTIGTSVYLEIYDPLQSDDR